MTRVKNLAAVLIAVLLLAAVITIVLTGKQMRKMSADFERVTGLYSGSSVRILGVKVGTITDVEPQGQSVRVDMEYDAKYRIPADAEAFIVPPSLVADRFIQIGPVYRNGPVMADNVHLPMDKTNVPVELSTVLESLDEISLALGPNGANADGALSRLVTVAANNLRGNGEQIQTTVRDVSTLLVTLADNKDDLFGTIDNLSVVTGALRDSDAAVRTLTQDLATVSAQLSEDRGNLAAALQTLGVALGDVRQFVAENREALVANVQGITELTDTVLQQKQALIEFLDVSPLALQNLDGAYDPKSQSLRVKSNILQGDNPQLFVCQLLGTFLNDPNICTNNALLGDLFDRLPIPGDTQ